MKSTPAETAAELEPARERLLSAAIVEFADRGFEDATVRAICRRAEVNVNAVKYYFADKQGLYRAALRQAHASRIARLGPPPMPTQGTAEEKLRFFVTGLLTQMLADTSDVMLPDFRLLWREMQQPTGALDEVVAEFAGGVFALLDGIFAELLPAGVSAVDRHLLVFSVIGECMHYRHARHIVQLLISPAEFEQYTPARLADHILRVVLAGVRSFS